MTPKMSWLAAAIQLSIAPVFLGALGLWLTPARLEGSLAAGAALALLGLVHVVYWSRPWPARERDAIGAAAAMVAINLVLIHGLALSQPLVWLYPALVIGAGLRPQLAAVGIGLMALAAVLPAELENLGQLHALGPGEAALPAVVLGPGHAILLAVALAGLGVAAVRQLIIVNVDLHAAKAELAELAVTAERERLARELHDVLGRTLSLIAVKAELAGRLHARGDPAAASEMGDVQGLAREALREVRGAITGDRIPSVANELAAAPAALGAAGIAFRVDGTTDGINPKHDATVAWVMREAVTNVIRHSGARSCRMSLRANDGATTLEVFDDGHGAENIAGGTGLEGLAQRVRAQGGTFEAGPGASGGFRLRVSLGGTTHLTSVRDAP